MRKSVHHQIAVPMTKFLHKARVEGSYTGHVGHVTIENPASSIFTQSKIANFFKVGHVIYWSYASIENPASSILSKKKFMLYHTYQNVI